MKTYQDLITIVELGPIETALVSALLTSILVILAWSAKTGIAGDFIGFDFSWIKRIFNRKRESKTDEK